MEISDVLIRPLITEKSMAEAAKKRYTFVVARKATKGEIKKAVEEQFKVNVLSLKTMIMKPKKVKGGKRRVEVKKNPWKKALVELPAEQKIEIFEVGEKK